MTPGVPAIVKWLIISLALCLPATTHAAEADRLNARGKAILQDKCARCHSIELTGDSALKQAPPMRTIYRRFNQKELRAELSEGMVSKHREMPQIQFSDDDVYAIMTYLYTLSVKK
jgi:mono/diheme cytochrome c family protein